MLIRWQFQEVSEADRLVVGKKKYKSKGRENFSSEILVIRAVM